MRQSPRKAIKDWVIQIRRHNAGPICGQSNLLLVMPAFGEFASRIKPVQRFFFSRPTDIERGRSKRVERFVKAGALFAGGLHHFDQNGWTKASIDGHAFRIQAVH